MSFKRVGGVLTRTFGNFASKGSFSTVNHDITIGRENNGSYKVDSATSSAMTMYIQKRRQDLGGGADNLDDFCEQLFEDLARYVEIYAKRGGYPQNHHSTFTVKDKQGATLAELKISSDVDVSAQNLAQNKKPQPSPYLGNNGQIRRSPF